jgi:hypothetical protein
MRWTRSSGDDSIAAPSPVSLVPLSIEQLNPNFPQHPFLEAEQGIFYI